jgi:hypothetical protein
MELPRRIVDGDAGEWERQVLLSGRLDAPSQQFRRRLTRRLGLLAGVAVLAGASTTTAKVLGAGLLLKWLGTGIIAGAVAGGLLYGARVAVDRASVRPVVGVRDEGRSSTDNEGRAGLRLPPEARARMDSRSAPVASFEIPTAAPKTPPPSSPSPAPSAKAGLAEETAVINSIQSALTAGDAAAALKRIDGYERVFPGGLLSIEAEVLRITALSVRGPRGELEWRARRFLALYPGSPYAGRVRSLLEGRTGTAR